MQLPKPKLLFLYTIYYGFFKNFYITPPRTTKEADVLISSNEIRKKFLSFFTENNHTRINGSSIIPNNDPTLLYVNSGMAPLKRYFVGEETPPDRNLCNVQPCVRTNDIDEVGDMHHLTSFEMLGSWSINNYFKKDAIRLAYKLLVDGLKIPREKLYVTVFSGSDELNLPTDEESASYWEAVGIDKSHIVYESFEDNFWGPAGEVGPCGPCTEIFYDTKDGEEGSYEKTGVFDTKTRYIEIWNAGVFMQLNKTKDSGYVPLKFKSVDTGAGLERIAMILNGLETVYETDLMLPIIKEIEAQDSENKITVVQKRIICDHIRTVSLILSEGVAPSNEGRGYIPRKLIRKIVSIISKNKLKAFEYTKLIDKVADIYMDFYSNFHENRQKIKDAFTKEQEDFEALITRGLLKLEKIESNEISGKECFELVSTYGMPFQLIEEYAAENNMKLSKDEFLNEFEAHKEKSKSVKNEGSGVELKNNGIAEGITATRFVGYEQSSCNSEIISLIENEQKTDQVKGDKAVLITESSPFYAESGGQCADKGIFKTSECSGKITDVQKTPEGVFLHFAEDICGTLRPNQEIYLEIDQIRRSKIMANHSAVHLLQAALRGVLGNSVKQAGSLVEENRLRFDFQYDKKLSDEEISSVEAKVNQYVRDNVALDCSVTTLEEAIKQKALAFFGDKYSDKVRIVSFEGISKELCGGTHTGRTGNIGFFKITSEGSIGRGIRRISAVTGDDAVNYIQNQEAILTEAIRLLKCKPDELTAKIRNMQSAPKAKLDKEVTPMTKDCIEKAVKSSSKGRKYIVNTYNFTSDRIADETRRIAQIIGGTACALCFTEDSVKVILCADKNRSDVNAGSLIKKILSSISGKGGGKPDFAQGGGKISPSAQHQFTSDIQIALPQFIDEY